MNDYYHTRTETYSEPADDEERVTVTLPTALTTRIEHTSDGGPRPSSTHDTPSLHAIHFEHPNGEEGIVLMFSGTEAQLGEAFDLRVANADEPVTVPFKHKADRGYNFCSYESNQEDDSTTLTLTTTMYDRLRASFIRAFGPDMEDDQ